jgi:hypothetical protein
MSMPGSRAKKIPSTKAMGLQSRVVSSMRTSNESFI